MTQLQTSRRPLPQAERAERRQHEEAALEAAARVAAQQAEQVNHAFPVVSCNIWSFAAE